MSRTSHVLRGAALAGLAGILASCEGDHTLFGPPLGGGAMFASYVALGNSLTAGYQSGGINDSTQQRSYAVLLAHQFGTRFAYPSLANPGCPPPLSNFATQARVTPAGFPASTGTSCYLRTTTSTTDVLNNVAVPGATSYDPTAVNGTGPNPLTTFILGGLTQAQRALVAKPTFATIWIGNNDILAAALAGLPGGSALAGVTPATPQATFVTNYATMMSQLMAGAPGLKGVLIGVIQVANAPQLFTAVALQNPLFLGALSQAAGTAVTAAPNCLTAPGISSLINIQITGAIKAHQVSAAINCVKGTNPLNPLDGDLYVLDAAEQATVSATVTGYNTYIHAKADSLGFAYYDANPLLLQLVASGAILPVPNLASATAPFGTAVSLDGVHPSTATHILIANGIIDVINAKYSTAVPHM
jgi:lysophospholipase L1-like esterase